MTTIQFIERDGKREFAVIPIELYERLSAALEDADDAALFDAVRSADDGFRHCAGPPAGRVRRTHHRAGARTAGARRCAGSERKRITRGLSAALSSEVRLVATLSGRSLRSTAQNP